MSNVRDERMFRTFRDGRVRFFRPATQGPDWFNLMSVHQNRHAYTETGYLPEDFLPSFLDLVVWGHEHECLINPRENAETGFSVLQPGSSIATSLDKTEAVPKHVAILNVTGRNYKIEPIRLKTVRPFKMREIVLSEDPVAKKLITKDDHRTELTRRLVQHVEELVQEADEEWQELQAGVDPNGPYQTPKLPLVRLRVEYSPPEGVTGAFDLENPQRFSNRFQGRVANVNDVVQFHRRKAYRGRGGGAAVLPDVPDASRAAALDAVKVDRLVCEFLTAQSLTILPQNSFGDAVSQFVDKDDRHAMELFVAESLRAQVKSLLDMDRDDEDEDERTDLQERIAANKADLEEKFASGALRMRSKAKLKPRPDDWDSDLDGDWGEQPGALRLSDGDEDDDVDGDARGPTPPAKGRGRPAAGAKKGAAAKKTTAAAAKKAAPAAKSTRGRKKQVVEEDEDDEDGDIIMGDDNDVDDNLVEESRPLFVDSPRRGARKAAPATRQTQLQLTPASQSQAASGRAAAARKTKADEIEDDDDDGFAPAPSTTRTRKR